LREAFHVSSTATDVINTRLGYGTSSVTTIAGDLIAGGEDITFTSAVAQHPVVEIKSTNTGVFGPELKLNNTKGGFTNGAPGDFSGKITFNSVDASQNVQQYAEILTRVDVATDGEESGKMYLQVANHDGSLDNALELTGGSTAGEVDVDLGSGAASVTTIAGTLTMGSTAFVNNSGVVQVATQGTIDHDSLANYAANEHYTQANIVATGTIASGTWQGTAIASAYLDADTAHLTTDQTFTGIKEIDSRKYALSDSATDGDHKGGDIYYYGDGATVAGGIYYIDGTSWTLTDADAEASTSGLLAVALGDDPDVDGMLLRGFVTLKVETEGVETIGSVLYLSTSTGTATTQVPGSGNFVRIIGYSLSTSEQIYFNPDNTWVEVS